MHHFLEVYCSDKTSFYIYFICIHIHTYSLQTCQNHFADICSVSSKKPEHSRWASCWWGPAEAAAHGDLLAQAPVLPSPESSSVCQPGGVGAEGALQMGRSGVVVPRLKPLMATSYLEMGTSGLFTGATEHLKYWNDGSSVTSKSCLQAQVPCFHLQHNVLSTQRFQLHRRVRGEDEHYGEHYG